MWAPEFGLFALIIALVSVVLTFALSFFAGWIKPQNGVSTSHLNLVLYRLQHISFFALTTSSLLLMHQFWVDDFSVVYVAEHSNTLLPPLYKIGAFWGGHEGSLLLWVWLLSLWQLLFLRPFYKHSGFAVLNRYGSFISLCFLSFILFFSNPWLRQLPLSPKEGADLNPLLQDPGLMFHPPLLYVGYVGMCVPFIFALYLTVVPQHFSKILPWMRRAALIAFAFLSIGITLGSFWAYYELGWGGFWFWDPVENASLMPWLACGALLHALRLSEESLKQLTYTIIMAFIAFLLSLLGTFIVRSGIMISVHAFAADPTRGTVLLALLGGISIFCVCRLALIPEREMTHVEINNTTYQKGLSLGSWILFTAAICVLLGTLYPLILEVMGIAKISVGAPYFNQIFLPLMLCSFVLMGIIPHQKIQTSKIPLKLTTFLMVIVVFLLVTLMLNHYFGQVQVAAVIGVGCAFLLVWSLCTLKNKRHAISMILAHLGMAITAIGISISTQYSHEIDLLMHVGDHYQTAHDRFTFQKIEQLQGPNYTALRAIIDVQSLRSETFKTLHPEKRYYSSRPMPMTETALWPRWYGDIYIALAEVRDDGFVMRIYDKPFVRLIWLGGILIMLGGFYGGIQKTRRKKSTV